MTGFAVALGMAGILTSRVHAQTAQEPPYLTPGEEPGEVNVNWSSVPGRTYFMQWSLDLKHWYYAPDIKYGDGGILSWTASRDTDGAIFYRLQYTDAPAANPDLEDFDGDGIGNLEEITGHGTDPLDFDTDGDGLADPWELAAGSEPLTAPETVAESTTGLSVHSPFRHPLARRPAIP